MVLHGGPGSNLIIWERKNDLFRPGVWFKHILFINGFGKAKMLHQPASSLALMGVGATSVSIKGFVLLIYFKQYFLSVQFSY
jgi:hypothetical protein